MNGPTEVGVTLDDKYVATRGRAPMTGVQALVRLTLAQARLDAGRGFDTASFVSGYQGSPLGGLDTEFGRARTHLDAAGVVFRPGLNEELAATAVAGTQMLDAVPGARHDGVVGYWYGKNPGLDRAADAIRHGNLAGTARLGGAVAIIGDDPSCKSSTVPSSCEPIAQSLCLPLLAPGSVSEVVEFGLHAVALSRATGLWTGLKIIADVADASSTVELGALDPDLLGVPLPPATDRAQAGALVGPAAVDAEHDQLTRRLDLARQYARETGLNRVTFDAREARLGILASGTGYATVLRALDDLGLGEGELDALGVRLIRLAMPFPIDRDALAGLVEGLSEVLVVEDKVPFLEGHLRDALYGRDHRPRITGRRDDRERPLLTARGQLSAEDVARAVAARLTACGATLPAGAVAHLDRLAPPKPSRITVPMAGDLGSRTPYFCSGCPHNTSTRTADDTLVGVGIGCHAMIALDGEHRGRQVGLTQMGGEGAQWFGLAPFTDDRTLVQNLGDGTFHHSGSLAIRAAVAAGVTMTYKLLYNDAVAMTGGQRAEGRMGVPEITRSLALEGVRRIVVTTDEPQRYRRIALDPIASVRHRDDLPGAERELAAVDGVTVLIHDDRCAAEERRLRKRGKLPVPAEKVVINERVCEGCGDCGDKSTCLSVLPVETGFGRKTRIHQASCNSDLSCLKGDCPSFLMVTPGTPRRRGIPPLPVTLTDPEPRTTGDSTLIRMPGIGGTGVVTASAVLQMAAHLDGLCAAGLEQVGLAQKGGPVVSDVRISKQPVDGILRASRGTADVLIGMDLVGTATDATLAVARPGHTVAVVTTSLMPTAAMVTGRVVLPGSTDDAVERIGRVTRDLLTVDAQTLAEALFDDHLPANMLLLGAAYQYGVLPVSAEALEQAVRLNGAAVERTLTAFRWGRAAAIDAAAVHAALVAPEPAAVAVDGTSGALARSVASGDESFEDLLATRIADLTGYQDAGYARRYAEEVRRVAAIASVRAGDDAGTRVAAAYARGLHTLMAYKDEYEVARLHLDPVEVARRASEYGPDARVSVMLHPPVLRALGMQRKIALDGRVAAPAFRALRAARRLRGTALDVFGLAGVRRVERELIGEYQALVREALDALDPGTAEEVVAVAETASIVRGYEDVKLANVERFRAAAAERLAALRG
ncbi:indolepyruvate ferredoxin oxidoreductase [Pseudonocardia sp. EC080610-09]|uniref:indolepyruvate ferredoxin oxidoreductase family protein n=1 Tax=unclassified Pseudonocardia TaxID=2619320 RepID=UPI0006CB1528|nr:MULTISPECIES: indolepyruvate ferredoxin oxidoreductase family protein [unclassified Pseudonocardia]ALE74279.1 indolepyruvate ferredoxin oxidoreductase [Pseudonocardia sp. EC080625-04]ALL77678.1 indolepyruvate ferredoxin oxidoreductase [Pseudonocardia sp. EC080610-09]ALL80594.1 indolepyruvate ferredoxin oxidoreductase [Pseudonocardia sp. EC080619-01]